MKIDIILPLHKEEDDFSLPWRITMGDNGSADFKVFPQLIQALIDGADIAIGSRHLSGSKVKRSFKRFLSRGYSLLLKVFFARFRDAQCDFKAIDNRVVQKLFPLPKNCYLLIRRRDG